MYALYSTIFPLFVQYLTDFVPSLFILQIFYINPAESLTREKKKGNNPGYFLLLKRLFVGPSVFLESAKLLSPVLTISAQG